ncbi:hypothetical protein C8F04DRAFT_1192548 [Mycena alexandri]|uniref:Uncharacterized protein n=1 Tax=Mycena alexandri TaxID=1745969 RepID=A0AAD6SDR8_9AGAR|nr:hypothetical protein C8F04DRAFT_1192543 [Mycena alexandri]KAJ7024265.1 hypothetical protein C8F04DRAFT_1192548 [Mycena alexandri]
MLDPSMCRGKDPNGDQCICTRANETYVEENTNRVLCHNCGHIESAHPEKKPTGRDLNTFIRSYRDAGQTMGTSVKATQEEAAAETNAGLKSGQKKRKSDSRSATDTAPPAKKMAKGKEKEAKKGEKIKLAKVILIVCGLDSDGQLRNSRAPSKKEMVDMRSAGLIVLPSPEKPIVINTAWDSNDVNNYIAKLFPKAMSFLSRQKYRGKPSDGEALKAQLFLGLYKQSHTLTVAGEPFPNGVDIADYSNLRPDKILFIASKNKIPEHRWDWADSESEDLGSDIDTVPSEDIARTPKRPVPRRIIKVKTEPGVKTEPDDEPDMRKAAKMRTRIATGALEYVGIQPSSDPLEPPQAGPSRSTVLVISDDEEENTPPPAESLSALAARRSPSAPLFLAEESAEYRSFFDDEDIPFTTEFSARSPSPPSAPPPAPPTSMWSSSTWAGPSSTPAASASLGPSSGLAASSTAGSNPLPPAPATGASAPWALASLGASSAPTPSLTAGSNSFPPAHPPRFNTMGLGRKGKDPWAKKK